MWIGSRQSLWTSSLSLGCVWTDTFVFPLSNTVDGIRSTIHPIMFSVVLRDGVKTQQTGCQSEGAARLWQAFDVGFPQLSCFWSNIYTCCLQHFLKQAFYLSAMNSLTTKKLNAANQWPWTHKWSRDGSYSIDMADETTVGYKQPVSKWINAALLITP